MKMTEYEKNAFFKVMIIRTELTILSRNKRNWDVYETDKKNSAGTITYIELVDNESAEKQFVLKISRWFFENISLSHE